MNVRELINKLSELNPNAQVVAFDIDTKSLEPVTGLLFDEQQVEICTDEI